MFRAVLPLYALIACTSATTWGAEPCVDMVYVNRNQVDYGPLALKELRGVAVDPSGFPVPGVCVGLFTEADHRLLVATATLVNGEFSLKKPPGGSYRLVATSPAFGAANARVRVGRGATGIILRMRAKGIDTTSYFESK